MMFTQINSLVCEVADFRRVLLRLTTQRLLLRYRRTLMGYFWTLFNPILMMAVTAVVFSTLFGMELKSYTVFLFAGMIPFNMFSNAVSQSSGVFLEYEALLKKIYIPRLLFPLSVVLFVSADTLLAFLVLMAIVLMIGGELSLSMLTLPYAFILLGIFCFGVCSVVSVVTVFLRDIQHIVTILLQAMFFLSPVIYDKTQFFGKLDVLMVYNPMVYYIDMFREPIYNASWPSGDVFITATLISVVSLFVGLMFFAAKQKAIIYRL